MKKFLQKFYCSHRNLILYCMIGCVGASLDFGIFSILVLLSDIHHQLANFFSISIGIITNFFLNYFFNFKSKDKLFFRLLSFYCVGLTGLGFSAVMLWGFIDCLRLPVIPAKMGTILGVTVLQYTLNKMISFRKVKHD